MASSYLTDDIIAKEALMILHQKCNFIGTVVHDYDDSFAQKGAKIGDTLRIRLPNEYTVRTGRVMNVQDTTEQKVSLTVNNYKGVDLEFDDDDLTLSIDKFAELYLEPAMSVLAANIESDFLTNVIKDVYNFHDGVSAANDFDNVSSAAQLLTENLAPLSQRSMLHSPIGMKGLVNDTKSLFQDSTGIAKQYREGLMGRMGGFDHYENTLVPSHTTGTAAEGDTGYNINNGSGESASAAEIAAGVQTLTVNTGTKTFKEGDIITIDNVYAVHPETKVSTGSLKRFVITADAGATATSLTISPPIITSGGRQNVDAAAANGAAINKIGGGASATWKQSLAYHKSAFAFATADLEMPKGTDMASRQVLDGISMRLVRDWDQTNASFPTRIDVLYGYVSLRPQLACRIGHNT